MINYDLYAAAVHFTLLYLTIIVLAVAFGTFGKASQQNRRRYLFSVLTVLFVLMAFRDKTMGNDTSSYIEMFNRIALMNNPFDYVANSNTESGYIIYCWILSRITPNPRILLIISSLFIVISIGHFAEKYVDNLGVFFSLFVGTLYFDFFLSGLRNALSIAIFLFAIKYLMERAPWKYFSICLLALLFHNTAVVYFVVYPLCSSKLLNKEHKFVSSIMLIVAAFLSGFFFDSLLELFFKMFAKYTLYIGGAGLDGVARLAVVMKILVCMLLILVPKVVRKNPTSDMRLDAFGRQMAMLNLMVMFVSINATVFMRVATLLQMYTLMQFSNEVGRIRDGSNNKIVLVTCTLASFFLYGVIIVVFRTPEWQTTYPIHLSWQV